MLSYHRIDVSERIYINKTIASKECNMSVFLGKGVKFQPIQPHVVMGVKIHY